MTEWQPIETYPHVAATHVNGYMGIGPRVLLRDADGWCSCGHGRKDLRDDTDFVADYNNMRSPTHWMPIPEMAES